MRINYYIILKVLVLDGSRLEKKNLRSEILRKFDIDISDGVLYPLIDGLIDDGILRIMSILNEVQEVIDALKGYDDDFDVDEAEIQMKLMMIREEIAELPLIIEK